MPGLDWLTAQPVAHRGLHDAAAGVIENTASAFRAAIEGGFAIETDLQLSADGEAMVHHDFALGRLTLGSRQLSAMTAAGLKDVPFKSTTDRIMTLGDMCDLVAGRVPMLVELKSRFEGDRRLVKRAADVLANYAGPVAVMSFDPDLVRGLREIAPGLPRGIVAERHYGRSGRILRKSSGATWHSCCTPSARARISSPTRSGTCPPLARSLHATSSVCR